MTRVKICGITSPEDAAAAVEAGADAVGLVFVPGTPRVVTPERAALIVERLPPLVATVGVFVDRPLAEVCRIVALLRLSAVAAARPRGRGVQPWRARPRDPGAAGAGRGQPAAAGRYPAHAFLLDAYVEGQPGGTGRAIPWGLALEAKGTRPIILSGGLRPETVAEAVRFVRPYGVDVSSGVEYSPGRKDHRKVREFIVNVRQADLG